MSKARSPTLHDLVGAAAREGLGIHVRYDQADGWTVEPRAPEDDLTPEDRLKVAREWMELAKAEKLRRDDAEDRLKVAEASARIAARAAEKKAAHYQRLAVSRLADYEAEVERTARLRDELAKVRTVKAKKPKTKPKAVGVYPRGREEHDE